VKVRPSAHIAPAAVGHHVLHPQHDVAVVLQPFAGGAARGRHAAAPVVAAALLQAQVVRAAGLALPGYGARGAQSCKHSATTVCLLPTESSANWRLALGPHTEAWKRRAGSGTRGIVVAAGGAQDPAGHRVGSTSCGLRRAGGQGSTNSNRDLEASLPTESISTRNYTRGEAVGGRPTCAVASAPRT